MAKKKSEHSNLLSFLSYKKPKDIQQFYIPEINEGNEQPKAVKSVIVPKSPKGIKKPIPVSQIKKEQEQEKDKQSETVLAVSAEENIAFIKESFNAGSNKDIVIREFTVSGKYKAFIAYLDGMVDRTTINNFILRPLLRKNEFENSPGFCLDYILNDVIETNQATKVTNKDDVIYEILVGNTCLYVEGCNFYISSETKGYDKRGVEKPLTEAVVRGAQEGFTENLRTNTTLIRRIIKNKDLTTEFIKIGERNKNLCAVMYLSGVANPAIINEVKRRIGSLKTDFIAGSGMLEQFIEENPWSLVPTILSTERPDRAASHIVEGKVIIIAEGTPFALVVPVTIATMLHSPEDTSLRWQYGTLLRVVRLMAIFIGALAPALYVAVTGFHKEMIPTDLLIAIAKSRENVPFPTIVEVLLMELSFELIREAGIRIPSIIGNTIGIIGALILGQAAVQANLVSPVLIIIVAITGLGNFAIPDFSIAFAVRIARLIFIVLAAILGFYGITLGLVASITILANTKSFGVSLLSSLAPKLSASGDLIIRKPVWQQQFRPDNVNAIDTVRQPKISRKWTIEAPDVPKRENTEGEGNTDE